MDRQNLPEETARIRDPTANSVDDFLYYQHGNLTNVSHEKEDSAVLQTKMRPNFQQGWGLEVSRMPDLTVPTVSSGSDGDSDSDRLSLADVLTDSNTHSGRLYRSQGLDLNSVTYSETTMTPSTFDTNTDATGHFREHVITGNNSVNLFTSAVKSASPESDFVTSAIEESTTEENIVTYPPQTGHTLSSSTVPRLTEIFWNSSRPPDITKTFVNYTLSEDNKSVSEELGIISPTMNSFPENTVPSENMTKLSSIFSHGLLLHTESSAHNSFHNMTSSSWYHDMNITFQDRTSLTSGEPTSFNFDLASFVTLSPPSSTEDIVDTYDNGDVTAEVVLKVILLALISLVGSFGNVMVIWSVVKERGLHRPPFYFLLSLGVTDLSRAIFCVPVVITTVLHGSTWRHGESACKLFAFATSFFVFSSALSLLAVAIDRHISIVYSKTYRRRSPGIANLVVAIIIWVIAFSVSFPPVVGVGDYVFIPDEAQCAYQHKHYSNNDSVSSSLVFIAILFLTYLLYFRIFRFLRAHRRMRPLQHTPALSADWAFVGPGANGQAFINWLNGFGGQAPVRQGGQRSVQRLNFGRVVNLSTAKNEHLTRLFLVITVVFGVMWLPYIVLCLWRIFFDASLIPSAYMTASAWLGYAQVALCPVVYFLVRGPVRRQSRTIYSHAEKREFLLENKTAK